MRAGDLRERIEIQQVTTTRDSTGATVENWTPLDEVFACVLPQRYQQGMEALAQALGREAVATSYTVTIYWRSDVTELNRLDWRGKLLDIRRVIDPDGKRTWLELLCEELPR